MKKQPLNDLLHDLEQEMLRLGYSKGSMTHYRSRWKAMLEFAEERKEIFYSEQLGLDFLENHFRIVEKDLNHTLSQYETQEVRIIRMIGDFQLHRTILRRYYKHRQILTEPSFISLSNQFQAYCADKGYSKVTIDHYVKQSAQFMDYLASQHVVDCKRIDLRLIHSYIRTLAGYTYKTVEQNMCSMRAFFRFLLEIKVVQIDFAAKIPMIQARKQTRIPSVWTENELKRLIEAIDRKSPKGKRDYAIILLACCLGMRSSDIKLLKMENFRWAEKKIVFVQSKTKTSLSLPLTQEIGWAVIDYLKYGRPKIDCPYLFVRHLAPFGPFSEDDHLNQLIKRYMQLAHLPTLKKRRGMHSLRHTMASMLLEKDTPLSVIADILGHVDVDSTAIYLKVGMTKLKKCPLTFDEVSDEK
jgi:integrase/recombinase XerD